MKKTILFLFILIPFLVFSYTDFEPESRGELIRHTHYSLDYNEEHEQPNWVYYRLTYEMINGDVKRKDNFRTDKKVSTGSATPNDYKGCGYDRGHLCPAADMKISDLAMSETFYMSNISPQHSAFNRGKWSTLEDKIRSFIKDETDTLYIVTGPLFINNKGKIGKDNSITIPGFYYKAVYCPKRGGTGFLIPNDKISEDLKSWIVTIDLIEALTGIDFFSQLDDELENKIESQTVLWEEASIAICNNQEENIINIIDKDYENLKNNYENTKTLMNIFIVVCFCLLVIIIFLFIYLRKRSN